MALATNSVRMSLNDNSGNTNCRATSNRGDAVAGVYILRFAVPTGAPTNACGLNVRGLRVAGSCNRV